LFTARNEASDIQLENRDMSLTIDLSPDVEKALEEKARHTGRTAAEFAADLVSQLVRPNQESASDNEQTQVQARLAAVKRIGCYDTRVRAGLPPLSDDAISRESIYEGRGQ
jgi:hypothetical protein